jgi:UDP-glucose 4-epimerase
MNNNYVLVLGGAGFIGSHVNKKLALAGYPTIVLDNLSRGSRKAVTHGQFIQADVGDAQVLSQIFRDFPITVVMHFAAFIDVGESVLHPLEYYKNNVVQTLQLLETMIQHNIKKIIFSSTAAIFGNPIEIPVKENHPKLPINPYGRSKLMIETLLQDFDTAYGMKSCCLRYFNAAGGDPDGELKNHKTDESNLIPLALRSLMDAKKGITIFGTDYPSKDGTCIRDYIHVYDLADAHIAAMQQLLEGKPSSQYNLGNGLGFSVREVLQTIEKVTGKSLNIIEGKRRPGDPPILVADSSKARRELNWIPHYPELETIVEHAWNAIQ